MLLFADAKAAKDAIQNIVGVYRADNLSYLVERDANLRGDQLVTAVGCCQSPVVQRRPLHDRHRLGADGWRRGPVETHLEPDRRA